MDRERTFELTRRHLNAGKIETYERYGFDAVMGRREGIRFWDAYDDRSWINCHCNGGVFNLGHRNPAVLAAVQASFEDRDIGNHHLPAPSRAELARRLVATTNGVLPGVVFGVSGGEASDLLLASVPALVDLIGNLKKERLEVAIPPFLTAANRAVDPPITKKEIDRYYRNGALMWEVLQRLRRTDRWWQRTVRKRSYPFLLPGKVVR